MGARFYSPQVGRFTQRDPIGYSGGLNLYGYVGNNPVAYVDPSGNSVLGILNPGTIITVGPYVLGGAAVAYGGYLIYQHYSSPHPQNASGSAGANPSLLPPNEGMPPNPGYIITPLSNPPLPSNEGSPSSGGGSGGCKNRPYECQLDGEPKPIFGGKFRCEYICKSRIGNSATKRYVEYQKSCDPLIFRKF